MWRHQDPRPHPENLQLPQALAAHGAALSPSLSASSFLRPREFLFLCFELIICFHIFILFVVFIEKILTMSAQSIFMDILDI